MPRHTLVLVHTGALLLALMSSCATRADDAETLDPLEPLTPQALVQAVEASNQQLKALAAAAQAAALRIEPASALDDPRLMVGVAPRTAGGDAGLRSVAELRQALPWPGTRALRSSVARRDADAAHDLLDIARLDVVAAAQAAHAEWHYVHRAIEINDASRDLLSEHTRIAAGRYAAGRAPQQDVLQAELELLLLEEQRRALEQQRTMLRARINALLGRAASAPLPPPAGLPEPGGLPDIELLRAAITREHPELSQLEHAIAGAGARAQLAELALRPNFDVNVGYNQMWPDRDMRLMIGVGINVPVQRAPRRAELDAALAERRRAEHMFAEQTAVLLARLETAYASSVHALEVIGLHQERLLVLVDHNVEAALTAYQSGEGQFLNVVAAERQRLATRQSYERTRADYRRAVAELELAAGGSLDRSRNPLSVR